MRLTLSLIFTLAIAAVLLYPRYPVFAQDSSGGGNLRGQIKQQRKDTIQQFRADTKQLNASRAGALKTALAKFRDQKKAVMVETIDNNLKMINQKRTEQMSKHLDVFSNILSKLEERVIKAGQNGKDTSAAMASINTAKGKVNAAKAAVQTQSQKDYTIEATSEATIRQSAQQTRDRLYTDLKAVRDLIIEAQKSVADAIRVAATSLGGNQPK